MGTLWENNETWFCHSGYTKSARRHYLIVGLVCGVTYVRLQESVPIFLSKTSTVHISNNSTHLLFLKYQILARAKNISTHDIPSYTFRRSTAIIQLQDWPRTVQNTPYTQGNTPYTQGNTPHTQGNTPYTQGNTPYTQGNTPHTQGNTPHTQGNTPHTQGNTPYTQGNTPHTQGNNIYRLLQT